MDREKIDALDIFVGRWTARGQSYGGTDQSGDPKANGEAWLSTHESRWHTGKFFVIEDEKADVGGKRFDTLGVLGVDEDGSYFSRGFENRGFYRHYTIIRNGDVWTFSGDTERARIEFTEGGRKQVVTWEWKQDGKWLPLCDRIAEKID